MTATAIPEAQMGFEIGVLTYSRLLQQTFLHMAMAVVPLESQLYFAQKVRTNQFENSSFIISSTFWAVLGAPKNGEKIFGVELTVPKSKGWAKFLANALRSVGKLRKILKPP